MAGKVGFSVILSALLAFRTACGGGPCEGLTEDEEWVWYSQMSTCYLASNHSRDFDSSLDFCQSFNGTLLTISGQEEDEFVQKEVRKCSDPAAPCADVRNNEVQHWMGLRKDSPRLTIPREYLKNYWKWIDGTTYNTSYMKWYEDEATSTYEPNGGPLYECVRLMSTGYWADQLCETPFRFICEKEVVVMPSPPPNIALAVGLSFMALIIIIILVLLGLWCAQRIKGMKSFEFEEDEEFATPFNEVKDPNKNNPLSVEQGGLSVTQDEPLEPPKEDVNAYSEIEVSYEVLRSKKAPSDPLSETEKNTDTGPIYSEAKTRMQTEPTSDVYAVPTKKNSLPKQKDIPLVDTGDSGEDDCTTIVDNEIYDQGK